MSQNIKLWLWGAVCAIFTAFVQAVVGYVGVNAVDPDHTAKYFKVVMLMCGFQALSAFWAYIQKHPPQDLLTEESHTQSVAVKQEPGAVTTTTEKVDSTRTVAVDPKQP